jgi:hypothetical protein
VDIESEDNMSVVAHLMERAKVLARAGKRMDAMAVLDTVVRMDPGMADAWLYYNSLCYSEEEVRKVREYYLQIKNFVDFDNGNTILSYLNNHLEDLSALSYLEKLRRHDSFFSIALSLTIILQFISYFLGLLMTENGSLIVFPLFLLLFLLLLLGNRMLNAI